MGSTPIVPVMKPLTSLKVPLGYAYTSVGTAEVNLDILLHTLIIGKSRTGKSTAALAGIVGAMRAGLPVFVIDPHGNLIEQALRYVPEDRLKDLFLVDPTSFKVPGFGFFNTKDTELSLQDFMEFMEVKSGKGWGPESARAFRNTGDATLESYKRPTVLPIYQMLQREAFARKLLGKSKNPLVQDFYDFWFSGEIKARDRMTAFSHPLNKIDEFLRPGVREILLQRNPVKWEHLLDSRKIVFINLQKGKIGKRHAQIIGSVALMNIVRAASRRKKPELKAPIFIDEAHNFLDVIDLELALAESAKWGVVYHLIDQNLTQMRNEDMKIFNDEIALGNCSSIISFRVSGKDGPRLTQEFGEEIEPRKLVTLPNYTFFGWTLDDGLPVLKGPVSTYPAPALRGDEVPYESALAWGRENTGTDKAAVEADIMKRLNTKIRVKQEKKSTKRKARIVLRGARTKKRVSATGPDARPVSPTPQP